MSRYRLAVRIRFPGPRFLDSGPLGVPERPRIDPGGVDRPLRPTKSTQHRSKRPLDRPKSTEDRPKRPPRDDSGRFSSDLGSIWVAISRIFDAARRLAARRADLEFVSPCAHGLRCALCAHDSKINRKSLREAFPSEPCEE